MQTNVIYTGDALDVLRSLPDESVHCCVTSPPYWGLRDYGVGGQYGLEATPGEYVDLMVRVFQEVRRVLRGDGTCWINLGDTYATGAGKQGAERQGSYRGLKPKDLVGIPWRVAFALQEDGWYLRSDIILSKPNPMPSSVKDRPTCSHEYLFLLSKSRRYHYDAEAVREPAMQSCLRPSASFRRERSTRGNALVPGSSNGTHRHDREEVRYCAETRNRRSVWEMSFSSTSGTTRATAKPERLRGVPSGWDTSKNSSHDDMAGNYSGAEGHFATFPEKLPRLCILAGCPVGGIVLDLFMGSGTTAVVATKLARKYVGIEINPAYVAIAEDRIAREGEHSGNLFAGVV